MIGEYLVLFECYGILWVGGCCIRDFTIQLLDPELLNPKP